MSIRIRTRPASSWLPTSAPEVDAGPWRGRQLVPPQHGPFAVRKPVAEHPLTSFVNALTSNSAHVRDLPPSWSSALAPQPTAFSTFIPRLAVAPPMTNLGATVAAIPTPAPTVTPPRHTLLGY